MPTWKINSKTNSNFLSFHQVIINQHTQPLLPFELVHMKPTHNQLNASNFKIQHLVDNIYVIYLQNTQNTYTHTFLTDIYNLHFKFGNAATTISLHLCIETTTLPNRLESLNLVQFEQNTIYLNSPVIATGATNTSNSGSFDLMAYTLDKPNQLKFQLNDEQLNAVCNKTVVI